MKGATTTPTVRVLLSGHIVRDGPTIVDASSSVTLVTSGSHMLVVDTGSPRDSLKLERSMKAVGISPGTVEYVVNTHLHIDHTGCNDLFTGARFVAHPLEDPPVGTVRVDKRMAMFPGVEIVPTPGHTAGCLSVFVDSQKRHVIAGDALPTKANYDQHVPPFLNVNPAIALRSMDLILGWAEIVVPGHDAPFDVIVTSKSVERNHHRQ